MKQAIRILVANRPRLMRELILATLEGRPGIEIVGEVADESEIPASVRRTAPDLVVISLEKIGERPRVCDVVLRTFPETKIIAVASEHNRSVYYWASVQLEIHSSDIEPSQEGFFNVMRNLPASYGQKM